jgi:hypothetical protein
MKNPPIRGIIRSIIIKRESKGFDIKLNLMNKSNITPKKTAKLPKRKIVPNQTIFATLLFVIFSDLKRIFSLDGIELRMA